MYKRLSTPYRTFLFVLLFAPIFSFAQTAPASQSYQSTIQNLLDKRAEDASKQTEIQKSVVGAYLDVKVDPPSPGPNTTVEISIESYLVDLYKSNITWSVNGTVAASGMGKVFFNFNTGSSGQTTLVSLSFTTNKGELVKKDFYFTPVGVTIMWEADTYTPPFYKGKALLTYEAGVRAIAVPDVTNDGSSLGSGNLVYLWKKDGNPITASSGFGRNSYSFTAPRPLTNTKITLSVSSLDDTSESEMNVRLPQVRPFIVFYEKDPLLGVRYEKPFDAETTLGKNSITVVAEPYFFSNDYSEGSTQAFKYGWVVNGKTVRNYGRSITLRNDTGSKGSSLLSFSMSGLFKTFQSARRDLVINFNEAGSSLKPTF